MHSNGINNEHAEGQNETTMASVLLCEQAKSLIEKEI